MAAHAGSENNRDEATDQQSDGTVTCKHNQANEDHDPEHRTIIHNLCPEVLADIFSKLSCQDKTMVAQVCSRWHDLIDIPFLWRDFCPILDVDKLTPYHTEKMRIRAIRKVKVVACSNMEKMTALLCALPCLKELLLLPQSLPRLNSGKHLFPGIQHLTINTSLLSTDVLQSFLKPMVNLQDLTVDCIPDENILCAFKDIKGLVTLNVKCSDKQVDITGTSMDGLEPISSLRNISLVKMAVGDSGIEFINKAFPQLEEMHLTLSSNVTSAGLGNLGRLKELSDLKIRSVRFEHDWMEHLYAQLAKLTYLGLYGCKSISKECLYFISKMPALKVLQVPIQDQEEEGLHTLSQGCHGLQSLCLVYGNKSISQGLHAVKDMPSLQALILQNCKVVDDFWQENSKNFSKLKILKFINCRLLSDRCLYYLSEIASLEVLHFKKCNLSKYEGDSLLAEKRGFKSLTSLSLIQLGMQNESLMDLLSNALSLNSLTVLSCDNITEDDLVAGVSILSHLSVLQSNIGAEAKLRLKSTRPHLQFLSE